MAEPQMPFDHVRLLESQDTLAADAFMALPLHERIRHILGGKVEFLRAGTLVDRSEALAALRRRQG